MNTETQTSMPPVKWMSDEGSGEDFLLFDNVVDLCCGHRVQGEINARGHEGNAEIV